MKKLDLRIMKNNIETGNKTFYDIFISLIRMYDILKFGIIQGNIKLILGYPKFVHDWTVHTPPPIHTNIHKDIVKSAWW